MSKKVLPRDLIKIFGVSYRAKRTFVAPAQWTPEFVQLLLDASYIELSSE